MSTIASVSSVELKLRYDEIVPRATAAVSTGTASAAACRALSFSAFSAFFWASVLAFGSGAALGSALASDAGLRLHAGSKQAAASADAMRITRTRAREGE